MLLICVNFPIALQEADKMVQQVQVPATQPDCLDLISETHMVERETQAQRSVL